MHIYEKIEDFKNAINPIGTLVGIDYGQKKIGLSLSSPSRSIALPLAIIENSNKDKNKKQINAVFDKILSLIVKKNVVGFVIGLPVHIDGTENDSTKKVREFSILLHEYFKLPIYFQEERRTSRAADSLLQIAGFSRKERNNQDDSVAATLILESTLAKLKCKIEG